MNTIEPGGGWLSGPSINPLPPVAPPNRADDHAIVTEACKALEAFPSLDRKTVRTLLPMWEHFTDMAPEDMIAVLRRFPGKGE
jgi:hypothetical protein